MMNETTLSFSPPESNKIANKSSSKGGNHHKQKINMCLVENKLISVENQDNYQFKGGNLEV